MTKHNSVKTPQLSDHFLGFWDETIKDASAHIYHIDLVLKQCAIALGQTQPSIAGKIDIRFWRTPRQPYVFRWKKLKNGNFRPVPFPPRGLSSRAYSSGVFSKGAPASRQILSHVEYLIKQRTAITKTLSRQRLAIINMIKANTDKIDAIDQWLDDKMPEWSANRKEWLQEWHDEKARKVGRYREGIFDKTGEETYFDDDD